MNRKLNACLGVLLIGACRRHHARPRRSSRPPASPGEWLAHYTSARTLGLGWRLRRHRRRSARRPVESRRACRPWTRTRSASRARGCSRRPRSTRSASRCPAAAGRASACAMVSLGSGDIRAHQRPERPRSAPSRRARPRTCSPPRRR